MGVNSQIRVISRCQVSTGGYLTQNWWFQDAGNAAVIKADKDPGPREVHMLLNREYCYC